MPFSRYAGILYPDDIAALQRVFTRICAERGISTRGAAAEHLAAQLVELRKSGLDSETDLLEAVVS